MIDLQIFKVCVQDKDKTLAIRIKSQTKAMKINNIFLIRKHWALPIILHLPVEESFNVQLYILCKVFSLFTPDAFFLFGSSLHLYMPDSETPVLLSNHYVLPSLIWLANLIYKWIPCLSNGPSGKINTLLNGVCLITFFLVVFDASELARRKLWMTAGGEWALEMIQHVQLMWRLDRAVCHTNLCCNIDRLV